MSSAEQDFVIESWTYLAIDIIVVSSRCIAQLRTNGFRGLSVDDFLMVVAILLYTAETATAYYVGAYWQGLANNDMTDEQRAALDPASNEYYLRVKGSQTQLFGWLVYTVLLWTLKLCWLFFYKRLGDGIDRMSLRINIGFFFVGITFFTTFFTILCGCWPISKHWQINPNPGTFCQPAVSPLQAWTLICTNLCTDFYIMTIPLPMVRKARVSVTKKIGLVVMFCGGVITAIFGGLRCGYILENSPNGPEVAGEWSCRESFVAVFVSNFPVLFPIIHRACHGISLGSVRPGISTSTLVGSGNSRHLKLVTLSAQSKGKKFKHPLSLPGETFYERYGSEEEITATDERRDKVGRKDMSNSDDIIVTTEWQVQGHDTDAAGREREVRRLVTGSFREV